MRWPLVAGTVAVLALGITTAFNTARLSRMEQETQSANLDAEMQTLGTAWRSCAVRSRRRSIDRRS